MSSLLPEEELTDAELFEIFHDLDDVSSLSRFLYGLDRSSRPKPDPAAMCALIVEKNMSTEHHDSPLTASCRLKRPATVGFLAAYLLAHDFSSLINSTTKGGRTALTISSFEGDDASVRLLLAAGADVSQARTDGGATSLYVACQERFLPVVDLLLAAGADVNQARDDGTSPFFVACQKGDLPIVNLLMANGADVNQAKFDSGSTPLYAASCKGDLPIVTLLLSAGADVKQASGRHW